MTTCLKIKVTYGVSHFHNHVSCSSGGAQTEQVVTHSSKVGEWVSSTVNVTT